MKDYNICRHENECENKGKGIPYLNICYSCIHYIGKRLDCFKTNNEIKQALHVSFNKTTTITIEEPNDDTKDLMSSNY